MTSIRCAEAPHLLETLRRNDGGSGNRIRSSTKEKRFGIRLEFLKPRAGQLPKVGENIVGKVARIPPKFDVIGVSSGSAVPFMPWPSASQRTSKVMSWDAPIRETEGVRKFETKESIRQAHDKHTLVVWSFREQ